METFAFLPIEGERIFTVAHEPSERQGAAGVLFVHPMLEEKLWAARATTRLARHLAAAGLPVLRFDFRGHGDSERLHEEMRLDSMRADIQGAARHLKERLAVEELHLFGLRFGGSLAACFAEELGARSLALVNPVAAGGPYLMTALRSNLTTQLSLHGKVTKDRQALVDEMRATGLLNIDGYRISAALFDEIGALDPAEAVRAWAGPALLLSLSRSEGAPPDADSRRLYESAFAAHPASRLESLVHPPLWSEQKDFVIGSNALFSLLGDWFLGGWRRQAA